MKKIAYEKNMGTNTKLVMNGFSLIKIILKRN